MRSGRRLFFCLCVAACAISATSQAAKAVDEIWFSTSSTVPGTPGNTTATFNSLGSQTLYVWLTSNVNDEISPTPGYTDVVINGVTNHVPHSSATMGLNYGVTSGSSISLTGAGYINPVLVGSNPANTRWDFANNFGPGNMNVTPTLITQINATSVSIQYNPDGSVGSQSGIHRGLSSANDGTGGNPTDPNYVSGAWMLGTVSFDTTALGTSVLAIQKSALGIYANGDGTGTASDPGILTNKYAYDQVTINVVPEPASMALLGLGALAMMGVVRRKLRG